MLAYSRSFACTMFKIVEADWAIIYRAIVGITVRIAAVWIVSTLGCSVIGGAIIWKIWYISKLVRQNIPILKCFQAYN